MDKKILDELNKQDWVKIRKTLISIVIVKLKYNKVTVINTNVIDFVDNVITKTFLEDRKWDPERVSLIYFLQRTIDSEISNYFKKKENTLSTTFDIYENEFADKIPDDEPDLGDKLDSEKANQEKIKSIREILTNDEAAGIVFEYLFEGCSYEEIREKLCLDSNQLNNILKRLKRKTLQ